ncbi:MAG: hypothetical protein ACFCUU_07735 [Cyclobacteriaceae bacterium]
MFSLVGVQSGQAGEFIRKYNLFSSVLMIFNSPLPSHRTVRETLTSHGLPSFYSGALNTNNHLKVMR